MATTEYTFDNAHRLTALSHEKDSTVLSDYAWAYDTAGRVTSLVNADGTDAFTYDDNGQLTATDSDYQTDESYAYDANGNRTNSGYDTGDNNRLLSDGTYDYEYDANGNRTKKTTNSSGAYVEYEWDHRQRLTSVTFRTSTHVKTKQVTYKYDAFDRRIGKDVDDNGDGTFDRGERYVHDGTDIVLVFTDAGALTERLLYGPAVDQPLASENDSGDVRWLLADNQGTIRDVAEYDAGQDETSVVNHLQYGSFGNIMGQTNSSEEPRQTYTGREWDADAELYYYRARWYDAGVGAFISEDPIGFRGGDENQRPPDWTDDGPPIGLFNGMKTGAKAIVNSTADMLAALASVGFWDPDDVWAVDQNGGDVGYSGAAMFGRVGAEAASTAATLGFSQAGRVGQVLNAVDIAGNLSAGGQGAYDAYQNGPTMQNSAQMAAGVMGAAAAVKTLKGVRQTADAVADAAADASKAAKAAEGMGTLTGDFSADQKQMIQAAERTLREAGYDTSLMKEVIRADFPKGTRGMSMGTDAAAVGDEAFTSQAMLNHVLEEELRHLQQWAGGLVGEVSADVVRQMEDAINATRLFPEPK